MAASDDAILGRLREQVREAADAHRPLRLRGSGSKDFYGESLSGEVLELAPWRGIIDYEPSELVITARCGTALAEIQSTLAGHGQFLPFEPPVFGPATTLGGVIAAGLCGPRRMYAGAARDFVLGTRLLTGAGELLRFGGQVMKNVAGFDLSRLLCGSLGILGVITEVSLKVLPLPRAEATVRLELSAAQALERFNRWAGQPLPLSAASWWRGQAFVRLSGAAPAVRAARALLGGELLEDAPARAWWDELRDCRHPLFASRVVWRVSVPATSAALDLPGAPLIDWGGALRWYADGAGDQARAAAVAAAGTALCWKGPASVPRLHPLNATVAALHGKLKERFDPQGIFNPGRLLPGM